MTVNSWTDVGVAVAAIGTLVNTLVQQWSRRKLNQIHTTAVEALGEVITLNGKTIGNLADHAEGRRIMADVPHAQQTAHDRRYVEAVEAADHPPPTTPPPTSPTSP